MFPWGGRPKKELSYVVRDSSWTKKGGLGYFLTGTIMCVAGEHMIALCVYHSGVQINAQQYRCPSDSSCCSEAERPGSTQRPPPRRVRGPHERGEKQKQPPTQKGTLTHEWRQFLAWPLFRILHHYIYATPDRCTHVFTTTTIVPSTGAYMHSY